MDWMGLDEEFPVSGFGGSLYEMYDVLGGGGMAADFFLSVDTSPRYPKYIHYWMDTCLSLSLPLYHASIHANTSQRTWLANGLVKRRTGQCVSQLARVILGPLFPRLFRGLPASWLRSTRYVHFTLPRLRPTPLEGLEDRGSEVSPMTTQV